MENSTNISQALGIFLETMRPYMVDILKRNYPKEPWEGVFFNALPPKSQEMWNKVTRQGVEPMFRIDYYNIIFFPSRFRDEMAKELGNDKGKTHTLENCLRELQNARNQCQHFAPMTDDEIDRAFSNMITIANMFEMTDLREEINRLKSKKTFTPIATAPIPVTTITDKPADVNILDDGSPLKPWFINCMPHYDIRNGILDESVFAANINEVVLGTAPEVYMNPITFFAKTYVTAGLRNIVNRIVRALNGEETENRIISLQTGFGGGKTHTLISLYHIVKGGKQLLSSPACANLLEDGLTPKFENAKVVVFTNNTTDVSQGRETSDGIVIHTLWGEIAYQLGGREAYEQMRKNDEDMIAPSSSILKPIIEYAGTSLILIDELADYCVKASAKKVVSGNLYNQTNSFIQTLTEVVSSVPKCVLIATLPASKTEVADSQIGQEILDSLQNRITRLAANVKPVDDEEVFEVVRRRLFEQINDESVIDMVAKRYKKMFNNRIKDLPDYCDKIEYANKIKKSYPFHPELIEMFRQRWGSDSHFQRTRGVLRLLASIVQDLWKRRDTLPKNQVLIHTSDVCLEHLPSVTGTITSLMGSNWESVMLADVYGTSSNSYKIDATYPDSNLGHYRLTQGISTTLLMASVGVKQKGLDLKNIKLCVLRPNAFNHNDVDGALNKLEQVAHYMHSAKIGNATYWFESKANVNILISQAKAEIKIDDTEAEILKRIKNSVQFVSEFNVLVAPGDDIPERKELTLVIMHPKYAKPTGTESAELQQAITQIATKKGNVDRIYRNTIFYLVCSEEGRRVLNGKLHNYLACSKILTEYAGTLENEQKEDIQNRKKDYNKQVDEALITAYSIAARHSLKNGIEWYEIKNHASDFSSQIKQNLINEAIDEEWILKSIGRNVLYKNNMMPTVEHPVMVKELYEAFLRFDDKPMLYDADAVITTVNKYCCHGEFNVGVGSNGNYNKIYVESQVPFLDVTSEDYWLVDTSVKPTNTNTPTTPNPPGGTEPGTKTEPTKPNPEPTVTTYKKVTISGKVPMENYSQLFSSFVNVLKNNNLKIEVKFSAKSNENYPLKENSATVKSIIESAAQLGLDIEFE